MSRRFIDEGFLAIGAVAVTVGVMASDSVVFTIGCAAFIVSAFPWPPVAR